MAENSVKTFWWDQLFLLPTSGNSPSGVGKPDTVCNWLRTPTHFHIQQKLKFLLGDFWIGKHPVALSPLSMS